MSPFLPRTSAWVAALLLSMVALLWAAPAQARTVTDLAGRQVVVPDKVERVLLGEGRLLPVLGILDRENPVARLAAMMGDFERLDPAGYAQWKAAFPQVDKVPRVGRQNAVSFSDETALALRPQVAILGLAGGHGPSEANREVIARLEAAGIAVVFVDFRHDPLKNTPRSMRLLGDVLGKRQEADAFVTYWQAQLDLVQKRLKQAPASEKSPTAFLENRVGLNEGCCDTMVGLVGKLMDEGGARNVARGLVPGEFGTLNPELLLAQQPDMYIGTGIGSMDTVEKTPMRIVLGAGTTEAAARASLLRATQRRGIAQLQAVQQGRAHAIWHHFYNSPFNVVAVQVFAKWAHPQLFADLDPRATMQTMYSRFMPISLDGVYWVSAK